MKQNSAHGGGGGRGQHFALLRAGDCDSSGLAPSERGQAGGKGDPHEPEKRLARTVRPANGDFVE